MQQQETVTNMTSGPGGISPEFDETLPFPGPKVGDEGGDATLPFPGPQPGDEGGDEAVPFPGPQPGDEGGAPPLVA